MRKFATMTTALAPALLLTMGSNAALAQRGGGAGEASQGPVAPGAQLPPGDLDRTRDRLCDRDGTCDYDQDRDRLRDRDTTGDQDQDRDRDTLGDQDRDQDRIRDTTGDQDRDRDQDRLHTAQLVDDQLATLSLLTDEERARFRSEMRNATTAEERNRIRAQHQQTIQDRAREMGIEAPAGAPLGYQARGGYMLMSMLTEQERAQFMNRMRSAQSAQERQRIRNEMHVMARERAREMGIDVPEWYGQGPGPR